MCLAPSFSLPLLANLGVCCFALFTLLAALVKAGQEVPGGAEFPPGCCPSRIARILEARMFGYRCRFDTVWLQRCLLVAVSCAVCGCQDGPMYALKTVNPYFVMKEWRDDEALGVTDHERRKQLRRLGDAVADLPAERQQFWAGQLTSMIENDASAEMRRLAVRASAGLDTPTAMPIIESGLDDSSVKVRMEACRVLGGKDGDEAARMLAATFGTETDQDVRHAAVEALARHPNQIAIDSLRLALNDRNPATRSLAVTSLKGATGKDYGDDPDVWIAALEGKPVEETPTRLADRVRSWF